ncbi:hypothetical protein [Alishewanella tabrizica]|uniref:JAB domain-containing protein n=1 Tax=Alishewanella tabrizica TaxID=671278 RepID=A0ABQ2WKZ4_9ALTE|nr:hypothetical protein [Alishewanella tabrizica]GGW57070.1 hypothetical protein GCM10008111_11400 [Alishewanella tabrizica]
MLVVIEDHVIPSLLTSAMEAYEFEHKTHSRGKGKRKLETFGLLWGYVIPEKNGKPAKVVATNATIETSALRHEEWVRPEPESIQAKKELINSYWPHLELVGSFHSHPYDELDDVISARGWQCSDGDRKFFPWFHEVICPEQPNIAHVIVTVTQLKKSSKAIINRIESKEADGISVSTGYRKFWINAYATQQDMDLNDFYLAENVSLDVSAMHKRFLTFD